MKLTHTSHGIAGRAGKESDDAVRVVVRDSVTIAALADGVGSAKEGNAAGRRAVDMIVDYYLTRPQAWSTRRALAEFAQHINNTFYQESELRHGCPELLCTLSVVVLERGRLYGINVGDSPVMLYRGGKLLPLSQAHVLTEKGMEHGLTQAIGMQPGLESFAFEIDIEDGDLVTLCSDGVSNLLTHEQFLEVFAKRPTARHLVSVARESVQGRREHQDDATAIVLDVVRRGWSESETPVRLEVIAKLAEDDRIDGYRLLTPLEDGSRVWLAESEQSETVVLKFPPLEAADDEQRRDGFLREVWHATRIESEDFVRAFAPKTEILKYYVMDYIEAPTLREVLKTSHLGVEQAVALGQFLTRAGQFLLSRDHAHGDIKPENIAVLNSERAAPRFLMLDLGSSAEVFSVTSRAGTPSYLAPERFSGAPLSERTELYAIGVTLYEALTGRFPYGEVERFQTPRFDTQPKSVVSTNKTVPAWLEAVVSRAIAVDPESRYQNYSEMAFELSNPERVRPFLLKGTPLIERNPLRFFQVLSLLLFCLNVILLYRLSRG
jgi:serine/threonine protein phosphatase PrpC